MNFTPSGTTAPPNMPGARTEVQAKTKADDIVKKIRGEEPVLRIWRRPIPIIKRQPPKVANSGQFSRDKLP